MPVDVLPLHMTHGWGQYVFFYFLKVVMLHVYLTGMKQITQCEQIFCPYTPTTPGWDQKVKTFFFSRSCCILIKEKEVLNAMWVWPYAHPWSLGLGKKVRHWNCADMYILSEFSEFIVFSYDLSDTQDEHRCLRNKNYSLLLTCG